MHQKKILIGGKWVACAEGFEVRSPYSGEHLANVGYGDAEQNDLAISSAKEAVTELKQLSRYDLAQGLRKIASGIKAREEEFAKTLTAESAKPIAQSRVEISRGIATFEWAAGEAERFGGDIVPIDTHPLGAGKRGRTMRVPRGVIYGITPFNFPLNLVAQKVAPALASRNAIILKPTSKTPLTALLLGEVFLDSGLPASALQIVPTEVKNIDKILENDDVAMISFTGSAAVGWDLKARSGKRQVALELGGNAPVVVDKDADIAKSVEKSAKGGFSFSGQVCISVQRIYVHQDIYDEWLEKFVAEVSSLKSGDPNDEDVVYSNVIDKAAAKRIKEWIDEAVSDGAKILTGGNIDGTAIEATVLTDTSPDMKIVSEEVFGPVVIVEKADSFENAVDLADQGKYGLQAGVFTRDIYNANYAAENLNYGGVIINDVPAFRVDNMPYGGVRDSGFGREGVRYAMEEMTEIKLIVESY